ncbi:hypothetical protein KCU92_g5057, partial [Aureobasidium melanogenum]
MAIANFSTKITRLNANLKASYLRSGDPELLEIYALDKLDPDGLGHYQKLIIGEATSANTYYLQAASRACLVDARILHAGLSNQAKARLVDKFNDPKDPLKCLITMYDVGAGIQTDVPSRATNGFQDIAAKQK